MTKTKSHFNFRQAVLLAATACLLALLAWVGGYWWANQVAKQALDAAATVRASQISQSEVLDFTKLLDRTAGQRALVNDYFLTPDTMVNFLTLLEELGATSQVALEITEVAEDQELTVVLQVSGSFARLNQFVDLLSAAPYLININQLRLTNDDLLAGEDGAAFPWNAKINLTVVSFNQSQIDE